MSVKQIFYVTSNKNKFQEVKTILDYPGLKQKNLDIQEIQSLDLKEIVENKAQKAFKVIKKPVVVEDVGFYIQALNGFPGPLIKWFMKALQDKGICRLLRQEKNRKVKVLTLYDLYDGKKHQLFWGKAQGKIPPSPRGKYGFNFDTVFIPERYFQTYAQMKPEFKNQISFRNQALKKLKRYLEKF